MRQIPGDTVLRKAERLEIEVADATWNAGIQVSESFALEQYESFFQQHEFPAYTVPGTAAAEAILSNPIAKALPAKDSQKLRNLLLIIANYVQRGQGGPTAEASGTFADVSGTASKQAFLLLSRTDFVSIFSLLSPPEQEVFRKLVADGTVLSAIGVDDKARVFVKGYGSHEHQPGPTVQEWLAGILAGKDLLAVGTGKEVSGAEGRFGIDKKGASAGLLRFEARGALNPPFAIAAEWVNFARLKFAFAKYLRSRKGSPTDLKW
jgi:hypothetical protein